MPTPLTLEEEASIVLCFIPPKGIRYPLQKITSEERRDFGFYHDENECTVLCVCCGNRVPAVHYGDVPRDYYCVPHPVWEEYLAIENRCISIPHAGNYICTSCIGAA